jgi:hypothetical protein
VKPLTKGRDYADISCVALGDGAEGFSLATGVSCASTGTSRDNRLPIKLHAARLGAFAAVAHAGADQFLLEA